MKSILVTLLLLLVAVALYNGTIGGSGGTEQIIHGEGQIMSSIIQETDP